MYRCVDGPVPINKPNQTNSYGCPPGAQFENSVLTMAMFGRDGPDGPWANLKGAHFEGALISSSDVGRSLLCFICMHR